MIAVVFIYGGDKGQAVETVAVLMLLRRSTFGCRIEKKYIDNRWCYIVLSRQDIYTRGNDR